MSAIYINSIHQHFFHKLGINFLTRVNWLSDYLIKSISSWSKNSWVKISSIVFTIWEAIIRMDKITFGWIDKPNSILRWHYSDPIMFTSLSVFYEITRVIISSERMNTSLLHNDMIIFGNQQHIDAQKMGCMSLQNMGYFI